MYKQTKYTLVAYKPDSMHVQGSHTDRYRSAFVYCGSDDRDVVIQALAECLATPLAHEEEGFTTLHMHVVSEEDEPIIREKAMALAIQLREKRAAAAAKEVLEQQIKHARSEQESWKRLEAEYLKLKDRFGP